MAQDSDSKTNENDSHNDVNHSLDKQDYIAIVNELVSQDDFQQISTVLADASPARVAHVLESIPSSSRPELVDSLDEDTLSGEVLLHMNEQAAAEVAQLLDQSDWQNLTSEMDTADVAELLEVLPNNTIEELMLNMDDIRRQRIETNLKYPEGTAGRLMHTDPVIIRDDVTVETVYRYLRRSEMPLDTDKLMVVDRTGQFLGTLPLVRLVKSATDAIVSEVMDTDVRTFAPEAIDSDVALTFENHDLITAPVVDEDKQLLGRLVVDDVVDYLRDQGDSAFMRRAGLNEEEDLFAPVLPSSKRRAIWLAINLLTAFLASYVIGFFQPVLEQIVALAVLMPVVASMGGIAGSQTLTLSIRGLALKQINKNNINSLYSKELGVAFLNGVIWALVVAAVAYVWFGSSNISIIIAVAILINMLVAAMCGVMIPIVLERLKVDPAISAAVILTTVTDVVGFTSFLGLASLLII